MPRACEAQAEGLLLRFRSEFWRLQSECMSVRNDCGAMHIVSTKFCDTKTVLRLSCAYPALPEIVDVHREEKALSDWRQGRVRAFCFV